MSICPAIGALISDLTEGDEQALPEVISLAYLVLDQSAKHRAAREAPRDPRTRDMFSHLPGGWSGWLQRRPQQLHDEFTVLLSESYVDLALTDEETDAITDALLALLNRSAPIVTSAAAALRASGRLRVIPELAEVIRRHSAGEGQAACNAIAALIDVLTSVSADRLRTPEGRLAVAEARSALEYASDYGTLEEPWNVQRKARAELESNRDVLLPEV